MGDCDPANFKTALVVDDINLVTGTQCSSWNDHSVVDFSTFDLCINVKSDCQWHAVLRYIGFIGREYFNNSIQHPGFSLD